MSTYCKKVLVVWEAEKCVFSFSLISKKQKKSVYFWDAFNLNPNRDTSQLVWLNKNVWWWLEPKNKQGSWPFVHVVMVQDEHVCVPEGSVSQI